MALAETSSHGPFKLQVPPPPPSSESSAHAPEPFLIVKELYAGRAFLACGAAIILLSFAFSIGALFGVRFFQLPALTVVSAIVSLAVVLPSLWARVARRWSARSPFSLFPIVGVLVSASAAFVEILLGHPANAHSAAVGALGVSGLVLVTRGLTLNVQGKGRRRGPFSLFGDPDRQLVEVAANASVHLEAGDLVPTDVKILRGSVGVLERYLTPVPSFRVRDEGEVLFGGSQITGGACEAIALVATSEACLRRLELVSEPHVRRSDEVLRALEQPGQYGSALAVLVAATAVCFMWSEQGASLGSALYAFGLTLSAGVIGSLREIVYRGRHELVRSWARKGLLLSRAGAVEELGRVTRVIVDPTRVNEGSALRGVSFELLDDRVSREALSASAASLLGRSEQEWLLCAGEFCQRIAGAVTPERVLDLRDYDERGICGVLKGVEVSIGSEDFLVERGILLQPSDSLSSRPGEISLLIAIDDDLIGRIRLRTGQDGLLKEGDKSLWGDGIRVSEWPVPAAELHEEVLLVRGDETPADMPCRHQCVTYDRERVDLPEASLVAFCSSLLDLPRLLSDCRRASSYAKRTRGVANLAVALAVASVFVGIASPYLLIALTAAIAFSAVSYHKRTISDR